MNNPFSDPRNFEDPNNPSFLNSYKFENSTSMGRFARQISHNSGVSSINQTDRNILSVDCISDSIRQDVNTQYLNFTKESVEVDERKNSPTMFGPGISSTYEFPDNKQAKLFLMRISKAEVAKGKVSGNKVINVELLPEKGRSDKHLQLSVAKFMKQYKGKIIKESVELGERMAPLPKSTEFSLTYPLGDNKQVTKLTNIGGKVDRTNKRVRFEFDSAAARTSFRKKNKSVLSTIK